MFPQAQQKEGLIMATHLNWEHIYKWFKEERYIFFIDTLWEFTHDTVQEACRNDAVQLIQLNSYEECITFLGTLVKQLDTEHAAKLAIVVSDASKLCPLEYLQEIHNLGSVAAPYYIHPDSELKATLMKPRLKKELRGKLNELKLLGVDVEAANLYGTM